MEEEEHAARVRRGKEEARREEREQAAAAVPVSPPPMPPPSTSPYGTKEIKQNVRSCRWHGDIASSFKYTESFIISGLHLLGESGQHAAVHHVVN